MQLSTLVLSNILETAFHQRFTNETTTSHPTLKSFAASVVDIENLLLMY